MAIGYPLGPIKVRGSELGVAAVLFVGLFAEGSTRPSPARPARVAMSREGWLIKLDAGLEEERRRGCSCDARSTTS